MKTKTTKWISLVLCAVLFTLASCDRDDEDSLPGTDPTPFNLEYVKTDQDQMGDFASNAMAVFDDKLWSFGGVNNYGDSEVHRYWGSENGMNWASVYTGGTLTAAGRHRHSLTAFGDRMYLIGGTDNTGIHLSDIWATEDGVTWAELTVDAPFGAFVDHEAVVLNNRLYVVGIKADSAMHVWSTANGTDWVEENNDAFPHRSLFAMTVYNNAMYVIGGAVSGGGMTNEVWRSSNGRNWSLVSGVNGLMPVIRHTAITYNGRVLVICGQTSSGFSSRIYYSEDLIRWADFEVFDILNPTERALDAIADHCSLTTAGGFFWVFGGNRSGGGRSGAIMRFKEI